MLRKSVAIMNIDSSKISVLIGDKGVNDTFHIRGRGESDYAGFYEGQFLELDKLELAMGLALSNAEAQAKTKVESLYMGVPAEFSFCETKILTERFTKPTKVIQEIISEMYNKAFNKEVAGSKSLISCSVLWLTLDDGRKVHEFKNIKSMKVTAEVSLIYIENEFISIINSALEKLGILSVEYVSSPLAESLYLLDKNERDRKAIVINVGYITSSVSVVSGEGLENLFAFSLGDGHITADLCETFGLTVTQAEGLKKDIILSLSSKRTDCYEVDVKDKILPVPINSANEIVFSRIDMIARIVKKCLSKIKDENRDLMPVYLTGSGLSYINGARDYLAKGLGRNIDLIVPKMPEFAKPHLSSTLGVFSFAVAKQSDTLWERIKKLFIKE